MATFTSRLNLRMPDPTDLVSVTSDVNQSMSILDAAAGLEVVSSLPSAPYPGKPVAISTDSYRTYFNNGTTPASGGWVEILNSSGTFGSNVKLASAAQLVFGGDTNLFRNSANVLRTNDALIVDGALTPSGGITGPVTVSSNLTIGGDLKLANGATVYRNKLSTATTVNNTASEAFIASMTIPANDAVAGATYRLKAWGIFGVTGTPTLNLRTRLGGLGGQSFAQTGAQTTQSGVTNRLWTAELIVVNESTGVSASWNGFLHVKMAGVLAGTAPFVNDTAELTTVIDGTTSVTQDSTISNTFGLTATWNTANAANTITCKGFVAERVA